MEHGKIARMLKLAGWLAVLGIVFVFYISTPVWIIAGSLGEGLPWMIMLGKAIAGIPYLFALKVYFEICTRIGENRSFCRENVTGMAKIARLMAIAGLVWIAAMVGHGSGMLAADFEPLVILSMDILAMLASFAVAMVAKMMEYLLGRAAGLQEESDLTI